MHGQAKTLDTDNCVLGPVEDPRDPHRALKPLEQKGPKKIAGRSRQDLTIFPTSPIHRERFEKNMTENRQLGGESFDTGSDFASSEFET